MRSISRLLYWVVPFVALIVAGPSGCVQTTKTTGTHHGNLQPGDLPETHSNGGSISPDQLTSKDACPARLQEIEGALLEYKLDHHQLPPALVDLHSVEAKLDLTCPDSHQPYVYVPAGLRNSRDNRRIIVHDPVRNADGTWWCILFLDAPSGKSLQTFVEQLSDPLFRAYQ